MKKTIYIILFALVLIAIIMFQRNQDFIFGSLNEAEYKRLTTGANQTISYGKAILRKIQFGANDYILVKDGNNTALYIDAGSNDTIFPLNMIFNTNITANVTSSDGVVFTFSPQ